MPIIVFTGWTQWPGRPARDLAPGAGDTWEDAAAYAAALAEEAWADLRKGLYSTEKSDAQVAEHLNAYGVRYAEALDTTTGEVRRWTLSAQDGATTPTPTGPPLALDRYLVLMGANAHPWGGMRDFFAATDTWDDTVEAEVVAACRSKLDEHWKAVTTQPPGLFLCYWWQVLDLETLTVIAKGTQERNK
jgi:hypothetical protein